MHHTTMYLDQRPGINNQLNCAQCHPVIAYLRFRNYFILEIKPCGLVSRILDVEADLIY